MSFKAYPNSGRLSEKRIVITGAASGIGAACALRYASEGAQVLAADIDQDGLSRLQSRATNLGLELHTQVTNVKQTDELEQLRDAAVTQLGGLEVWHNNAFSSVFRPIYEQTLEEFDSTMEISLRAYWYGAKLAIQHMRERDQYGVIVNTASVQSYFGEAGFSAYQAAKGAILNMTRSMGKECAPKIRAVAIAPGLIFTPAHDGIDDATMERVVGNIPAKRGAQPEEVAGLAAFLASDEADYISATGIVMDGGYLGV